MEKKILLALLCGIFLFGCARFQRAEIAEKARASMVGMTKEQILQCMGATQQRQTEGSTEVWSYQSGGDQIGGIVGGGGSNTGGGSLVMNKRYCIVNIFFQEGRVKRIGYSGRTGGLITKGEQCAFAVENCVNPE